MTREACFQRVLCVRQQNIVLLDFVSAKMFFIMLSVSSACFFSFLSHYQAVSKLIISRVLVCQSPFLNSLQKLHVSVTYGCKIMVL